MRFNIAPLVALILSGGLAVVQADLAPGVDGYVANAEVIAVVQAETMAAAEAFPPPPDKQRVWVKDVLKGMDSAQEFLLPKGKLKSGQTAVVLFEYQPPVSYEPALQTSPVAQRAICVWPMDSAGNLNTDGVPPHMESDFMLKELMQARGDTINLAVIEKDIVTSSPEEAGLYDQVVDALLFPKKFRALAHRDARRATYVRFAVTIGDLNRDVPWLARLLESQDPTIRAAALKKLESLTGTENPAPKDKSPRALHEWAQAWAKQAISKPAPRWPPVPANLKAPPDAFPEPLMQALRMDDADTFAREFARWLDSGVTRDREIRFASTLDQKIVWGSDLAGAIGGVGAYLPPAPRLRPDVALATNIPAVDRMKAIALLAQIWHYDRFAKERAEAVAMIAAAPSDAEFLRRAAFWESHDYSLKTPGCAALRQLAKNEDEETQRFLLGLCSELHLDDDLLEVVRLEIKAGRQTFIDGLFGCLATHRDRTAQWIGRMLCVEGQKKVVPIMVAWLKDSDPPVRKSGALNLCWLPSADAVADLLDCFHAERARDVKSQMLVALAQTGDQRGLETLLAAAREPYDLAVMAEIVRGLGRIRDPKALPALADIVSGLAWIITSGDGRPETSKAPPGSLLLLSDAANAFGYISKVYEAPAPASFWTADGIRLERLKAEIERIEEWRKSQTTAKQYFKDYLANCATNEIRCVWFLHDDDGIGMVMTINLEKHMVFTGRDVYNWAMQSGKTRSLTDSQVSALKEIIGHLPSSTQDSELNSSVTVSIRKQNGVETFQYYRPRAPAIIQRIYDLGGGYFYDGKN